MNNETHDVSVKRLVHDHRQITQTQLMLQRELMMTPMAKAQVTGDGKESLDLVALLASQPEPDEVAGNQTDEPNLDSKLSD